jgi:biopolymer transport protein ExbD
MARHHIPESHSSHPNVTPLIDIIMCLIIFFMLVAKIGVTTGAEKIDIPTTILGTKIADMGNTVTLNIPGHTGDDASTVIIHALLPSPNGGEPQITNLQLHAQVSGQNQLENSLIYLKKEKPELKVIIRADENIDWRFIEPVLVTCNRAGVRTLEYNTAKDKGGAQ